MYSTSIIFLIITYFLVGSSVRVDNKNAGTSILLDALNISTSSSSKQGSCTGKDICSENDDFIYCCTTSSQECCGARFCCRTGFKCCGGNTCESSCNACFSSWSNVLLKDGRQVQMKNLKIGDQVLVGENKYSAVFMFTHQDSSTKTAIYRNLLTDTNHSLTATVGHYIYSCKNEFPRPCSMTAKVIEDINIGDLVSVIGKSGETKIARVTKNSKEQSHGLYNPQTLNGNIVVDGVLCTTYTYSVPAQIAHGLLAPLRALPSFLLPFVTRVFSLVHKIK